jgi:CDP-glycerol glycerophosphotransferase (TagB/SpsB family)
MASDEEDDFFIKSIKSLVSNFYIYKPRRTIIGKLSYLKNYYTCKHYQVNIAKYLSENSPDLIVLPNNKIFRNRFISKYAALNNILTMVLQDTLNPGGFGNLKSYTKSFRRNNLLHKCVDFLFNSIGIVHIVGIRALFKYNKGHHAIDCIAVWGDASKSIAISNKYTSKQISVTGQPRFDEVVIKNWDQSTKKICDDLDVKIKHKNIIFLPTKGITSEYFATRDEQIKIYTEMIESIEKIGKHVNVSIDLIIKLHRNECLDVFHNILPAKLLKNIILVQNTPLYPLLNLCDLAITTASTAGLEALLFDKPLITINFSGRPDFYNYSASGSAIGVNQTKDLFRAINDTLFNQVVRDNLFEKRKKYVVEETYLRDGKAAERSVELIKQILSVHSTD